MKNERPTWQLKVLNWSADTGVRLGSALRLREFPHRAYKKGEYIYMPEEPSDALYMVVGGKVKVGAYSPDGKEITKSILTQGDIFGELALVGEEHRRDFAVTLHDTELCMLPKADMQQLMQQDPALCQQVVQLLGYRLARMEQRLEALVFKDSRTRVIEYLRSLAQEKGQQIGYEIEVRGILTHQEMANLTATSRQTVTTVLNELRRDNVITFNRRRLLIRDLDKLH